MKSVMITGGTGAFGVAFAKHLLSLPTPPKRIVIFSRGEFRQFEMLQELKPLDSGQLRFMIGDVRDRDRLRRAMQGIEVVVHAAALKRIEVGNYNPIEVVKTNVGGAVNVIEAAQDANVEKVVALSSDKAFEPVSPYGTSKALAESIFIAANNTTGWWGPGFSVCRYGNVWGSTGSVVPVWRKLLAQGRIAVPVTDPECTRFFMRMSEAVDLVLNTIKTMVGREVNIPTLPAYRLGDLATAMGAEIEVTGLPVWEKRHESMDVGVSSEHARRMTVGELQNELRI
jgi:UDP-N-acetylglucosamine 4,6-dehydratase/5-epimerase